MPRFARVIAIVQCPACSRDLTTKPVVDFQWGYCSHPLGAAAGGDLEYALGDEIRWGASGKGPVPLWHYFGNGDGNIGDPQYRNLLVRECELELARCPWCATPVGPMVVVISDGRVETVRLFPEWPWTSDIVLTNADGSHTERPDWNVQGMTYDPIMPPDFVLVTGAEAAARHDATTDGS